ncbi:MAG: hypothetical protein K5765_01365 [Clostridia bacterium]|nr:hypothetical protein [Clostridia bacterium]
MKKIRTIFICLVLISFIVGLAACGGTSTPSKPSGGGSSGGSTQKDTKLTPKSIKALADLTDYGASATTYRKTAVTYDKTGKQYAGKSAQSQYDELAKRITEKHEDVESWESTSAYVKIFAMSDADEIMAAMAKAALTYDEMDRAVAYLSGDSEVYGDGSENVDVVGKYITVETDLEGKKTYTGDLTTSKTWRDCRVSGKDLNEGWSLFDDWELYDRLKDYAESVKNAEKSVKERAEDNASWQYRSILKKVYEDVNLSSDGAARTAVYFLEYAIKVVEEKSGSISQAIVGQEFGDFAVYCRTRAPKKNEGGDPFSSLGDYDCLSYLLSFDNHYNKASSADAGLKQCVTLYGYYYDYNKTYYFKVLKDEATYAKQLKYEKQDTFTNEEWLDYVDIQRKNYINSYRYSEAMYRKFYNAHFDFQGKIESYDKTVYEMSDVSNDYHIQLQSETYTGEMKKAITKSGSINGILGQLALSDWMYCYGGDQAAMKSYNGANTDYQNNKDSKVNVDTTKWKSKFHYNYEQLKIVYYLLSNMTNDELSSAIYYETYAYSGSMNKTMSSYIKNLKYSDEDIESIAEHVVVDVSDYDETVTNLTNKTEYGTGKTCVLYKQAQNEWIESKIQSRADNAKSQSWATMREEIKTAKDYDYDKMEISTVGSVGGEWEQKCTRLEDLVITRVYSCCGESTIDSKHTFGDECKSGASHNQYNADGTVVTKDYDTSHKISLFVSEYESILYRTASNMKITLNYAKKDNLGFKSPQVTQTTTYKSGYNGNWIDIERDGIFKREISSDYTIGIGKKFHDEIEETDEYFGEGTYNINTYQTTEENVTWEYTYEFVGFFLDEDCKYVFVDTEEFDTSIKVYAGYNVTKTKK